MTLDELDGMADLVAKATPAPWYIRDLDDDVCMGAVALSTELDMGEHEDMRSGAWPNQDIVAARLIQAPPYVLPRDDRWQENAELIAALRNGAAELLRLARLGAEVEARASDPAQQ